jgi:hypothetical protein
MVHEDIQIMTCQVSSDLLCEGKRPDSSKRHSLCYSMLMYCLLALPLNLTSCPMVTCSDDSTEGPGDPVPVKGSTIQVYISSCCWWTETCSLSCS